MTTAPAGSDSALSDLVLRFFEDVLNGQNAATARDILAPYFTVHHPTFPEVHGVDGVMSMVGMFHAAFPDLRYTPVNPIAQGNRAAVRWTATGTHEGPFMGIEPSHRRVTIAGADVFHAADGRLIASWVNSDFFGLFRQLGSYPQL
jgi:predicted ester cyclase